MPDDKAQTPPAAAALIAIVAAIGCAPAIQAPGRVAALLLALAGSVLLLRRFRARYRVAVLTGILAVAVMTSADAARRSREIDALTRTLGESRFVTVTVPADRPWRFNGRSHLMLATRFRVGEASEMKAPSSRSWNSLFRRSSIEEPLLIVSSSPPRPIGDSTEIVARGFLARTDDGLRILSVKSDRLIAYRGRLGKVDPRRLNRSAFRAAERYAQENPGSAESAGLAAALALGRSELLSDDLRDAYRRGGTYHFLVFSGLQVGAAAAAIGLLGRMRGKPRPTNWFLLSSALAIVAFTGSTPAITRACAGLGIFALSRILKRPTPLDNLLVVTAAAQLLVRPALLVDAGFQLTYAGAGSIVLAVSPLVRHWPVRTGVLKTVLAASVAELAVTPLTLFHFHQYSVGGPLLLPLLAPVVAIMLVLSAMALPAISIAPVAAPPLLAAISLLHRLCLVANSGVRGPLHLSGFAMAPTLLMMIVGYGTAIAAVALAAPRIRALVMVTALASVLVLTSVRARSLGTIPGARLEALDVGQGDALLLRQGASAVLVDGGGRGDDWRFGERRLLPLLLDRGVRRLDVVALSHAHPDHCGGLPAVISEMPVGEVWVSPRRFRGPCAQEVLAACQRAAVPIGLLRREERRMAGSIRVTALPQSRNFRRSAENNSSVVLLAELGGRRLLLTGDIEHDAEEALLRATVALRADVLKVAHHGSRTSTSDRFLTRVDPRLALISCGYRNSFGHPHEDVVERLKRHGINLLRTDSSGTVRIDFSGGRMFPSRQIDTPR